MICDEARPLISAYQDNELAADRRQEIEAHLKDCPACAALLKRNLKLSEAIRADAPTFAPPESLLKSTQRLARPKPAWRPFAGGLSVGLAAAAIVWFAFIRMSGQDFAADLVSDHVRSLMATHLIDVASSDRHTVKPWFLGKLDFAPTVPDLASSGYPLIGGRLDYVAGHPAAALVYQKQKHVINVLVMPERGGSASREINGYRVVHWQVGGLGYWAVSDLPLEDLNTFAAAFRRGAG